MRINLRKKKNLTDEQLEIISTKDFFDRTVPGIIKFYTAHTFLFPFTPRNPPFDSDPIEFLSITLFL